MQKITPCLWFNGRVEEALEFYTSVFKNGKIKSKSYYTENSPMPAGSILTAVFEIEGQEFLILHGGPNFEFNESISFSIECKDQKEVDYYWDSLTANGGSEGMCGWLKDPFGVSWQVVPKDIMDIINANDAEKSERVLNAVGEMKKLDIAKLKEAANG